MDFLNALTPDLLAETGSLHPELVLMTTSRSACAPAMGRACGRSSSRRS
jgi:hypothetical protein